MTVKSYVVLDVINGASTYFPTVLKVLGGENLFVCTEGTHRATRI
jgi:hypothetical protein